MAVIAAVGRAASGVKRAVLGHKKLIIGSVGTAALGSWATHAYATRRQPLSPLPEAKPSLVDAVALLRSVNDHMDGAHVASFGGLVIGSDLPLLTGQTIEGGRKARVAQAERVQTAIRNALHVLQTADATVAQLEEVRHEVVRFNAHLFGSHGMMGSGRRFVVWVRGEHNSQWWTPVHVSYANRTQARVTSAAAQRATERMGQQAQGERQPVAGLLEGAPGAAPSQALVSVTTAAYCEVADAAARDLESAEVRAVRAKDALDLAHRKETLWKLQELALGDRTSRGAILRQWRLLDEELFDAAAALHIVNTDQRAVIADFYDLLQRSPLRAQMRRQSQDKIEELATQVQMEEGIIMLNQMTGEAGLGGGQIPDIIKQFMQALLAAESQLTNEDQLIYLAVQWMVERFGKQIAERVGEQYPSPKRHERTIIAYQGLMIRARTVAHMLRLFQIISHSETKRVLDDAKTQSFLAAHQRYAEAIQAEQALNLRTIEGDEGMGESGRAQASLYADQLVQALTRKPSADSGERAVAVVDPQLAALPPPLRMQKELEEWMRGANLGLSSLGVRPAAPSEQAAEAAGTLFMHMGRRMLTQGPSLYRDTQEWAEKQAQLRIGGSAPRQLTDV